VFITLDRSKDRQTLQQQATPLRRFRVARAPPPERTPPQAAWPAALLAALAALCALGAYASSTRP
jgi:hypothetical protein